MDEFMEMHLDVIRLQNGQKGEIRSINEALKYFDTERFCMVIEWCFYNDFELIELFKCANNVIGGRAA